MNLTLSWDLFVIVFAAIVVTYTIIIGKRESVKVVLASYVAIVAVQGFGNILQKLMTTGSPYLQYVGVTPDPVLVSTIKLVLFVVIVILLAVRAGFEVQYLNEPSILINTVITALCGVATAGLLLSTLLTYAAGVPLLDSKTATTAALIPIIQESRLMQILIVNQDLFFLLPAVVLIAAGLLSNRS